MDNNRQQQQFTPCLDPVQRISFDMTEPTRLPRHCCVRQAATSPREHSGQVY